jgi:hypothetical protein
LLHEARTALRAGDLTVEGSQRYAAWDSDLYQSDVWATRRDAWYSEQVLPRDGERFVSDSLEQLHRQTQRVAKRMARHKNLDACVEGEKTDVTLTGDFRPLREYQGPRLYRSLLCLLYLQKGMLRRRRRLRKKRPSRLSNSLY